MPNSSQFFLASESPRRKKILEEAGFQFTVLPIKVSEKIEKNLNPDALILLIATRKMMAAKLLINSMNVLDFLVLTADTMVVLEGEPLGKPENTQDAITTLTRLSGRTHQVKTAVCLADSRSGEVFEAMDTTTVHFRPISRQEILDYVATEEPMDKAGSYAIQGLGKKFVTEIHGAYDNVVGLPLQVVLRLLHACGRDQEFRK
jgi:septum formation protein